MIWYAINDTSHKIVRAYYNIDPAEMQLYICAFCDIISGKNTTIPEVFAMNAILEARDMLRELTPLLTDCGELCNHAC
ncbi:MAG: hypothetical protein Q4B19_07155, partial [Clostridia bacterium]|nr:hypothetical protein [Clostridia bacterium]